MTATDKIASLLGLDRRLAGPAALFALHIFAAIALLTVVRSLINGLALDAYPKSFLPLLFASQAGFYLLFSAAYSWAGSRLTPERTAAWFSGLFIAVLAAARIGLEFNTRWLPFALYVTLAAFASILVIQSWGAVTSCLDSREAKKVLPIAGAAGTIGALSGGATATAVAASLGAENLLFPCLLLVLLSLASGGRIRNIAARIAEEPDGQAGPAQNRARFRPDPLILRFIACIVLTACAFTVIDYQFKAVIQASYGKDEIAGFLGAFLAASSLFTFLVQTFAEGRLLRRFGMIFGLASLPLTMLAGSAAFFLFPGMAAATGTMFFANTASYSLNRSARELTLMPYRPQVKQQLKILLEGVIRPGAVMLCSGAIAAGAAFFSLDQLSVAAAVCALLAILSALAMKKPFARRIEQVLNAKRLELLPIPSLDRATDPLTAGILDRALAGGEEECLFALELMRESGLDLDRRKLESLLARHSPRIRAAAVETVTSPIDEDTASLLEQHLGRETDPDAQQAVLKVMRLGGRPPGFAVLAPLAADGHAKTRAEAAISLFAGGGLAGIITAAETTKAMLASDKSDDLVQAARILGELGNSFFAQDLLPLMDHTETRVRHAAMAAAARLGGPSLTGKLLERLRRPEDAAAAAEALSRITPPPVTELQGILRETQRPGIIKAAVSALAASKSPAAAEALIACAAEGPQEKRFAAIKGLGRMRRDGAALPAGPCLDLVRDEIDRARPVAMLAKAAVCASGPGRFLKDQARHCLQRSQEAVFRLLGLVYDPATVHKACVNFLSGGKNARANALELLEHILPRDIGRPVTAFLELEEKTDTHFLDLAAAAKDPLIAAIAAWGWPGEMASRHPHTYKRSQEMIPMMEKIFFLKSVPFLADLAADQLQRVAEIFSEKDIAAGTAIFREGDPGSAMFVIADGAVKVEKGGKEIANLGPGDFFGEMALLEYAERTATVTATEDTLLLVLDTDSFTDLVMEYPEIALGVMRTLSRRLRKHLAETTEESR